MLKAGAVWVPLPIDERVNEAFAIDLPLRSAFEASTVVAP